MSKTFEVVLGGQTYKLHPLNLGELEDIAEATQSLSALKSGYAILKIALRRAEPEISDVDAMEAGADELKAAIDKILIASGMKPPTGETKPAG